MGELDEAYYYFATLNEVTGESKIFKALI